MERVPPARPSKLHADSGGGFPYHEAKKLSISILVISLPVLYVSLLHIPPSTLLKDTTFWFLMSNSIIIIVAADSGVFFSSSSSADDLYDEFVKCRKATSAACATVDPPLKHFRHAGDQRETKEIDREREPMISSTLNQSPVVVDKSVVVVHEKPSKETAVTKTMAEHIERKEDKALVLHKKSLSQVERVADRRREVKKKQLRRSATEKKDGVEMGEYEKMSNEELNKRVEEFIRRFNREIRLQSSAAE